MGAWEAAPSPEEILEKPHQCCQLKGESNLFAQPLNNSNNYNHSGGHPHLRIYHMPLIYTTSPGGPCLLEEKPGSSVTSEVTHHLPPVLISLPTHLLALALHSLHLSQLVLSPIVQAHQARFCYGISECALQVTWNVPFFASIRPLLRWHLLVVLSATIILLPATSQWEGCLIFLLHAYHYQICPIFYIFILPICLSPLDSKSCNGWGLSIMSTAVCPAFATEPGT